MRDIQLYVIGDSHANFWSGSGNQGAPDQIPGVRSYPIPGATAYSLLSETSQTQARTLTMSTVRAAVEQGFGGWLMLHFGANDCNAWIWRQVPRLSLAESVRVVVDRYVQFIHEIRALYPKLAIFAPPAATKVHDPGTEPERNLAILLFTDMLADRLLPYRIPVMSLTEAMIARDGSSLTYLYREDMLHPTQVLMPYALQLINTTLGLALTLASGDPLGMHERRISEFASVEEVQLYNKPWMRFALSGGAQYIHEIALWPETFFEYEHIEMALSLDRKNYTFFTLPSPNAPSAPTQKQYLPVARHSADLYFTSLQGPLRKRDVEIYTYGSHISTFALYCRESLFALRDQLLQQERSIPVLHGETVPLEVAKTCESI